MNERSGPTHLIRHADRSVIGIHSDIVIAVVSTTLMGLSAVTNNAVFCYAAMFFLPFGLIYPTSLIPVLMVTSLSSNFFAAAEGVGAARLFAIALVLGVIISMLREHRKINFLWLRFFILIIITTLLTVAINGTFNSQTLSIIGLNLIIAFAFSNICLNVKGFKRILFCVLVAFSIISILVLISLSVSGVQALFQGRVSIDSDINTNRQAMMCAQMGAFLFGYAVYSPKAKLKVFCYILGFVNFFICLISGSRTGCLALILGVIAAILIFNSINKKSLKGIAIAVLIAFIGFLVFQYVISENAVLADRFALQGILESGGTGRWDRIVAEIKYIIPNHLLFGVGPSSIYETLALEPYLARPGSAHNIIISMLTQIGIVGSAAYFAIIFSVIKRIIAALRKHPFALIPLCMVLTGLFNGIGEVMYCERLLWIVLSLTFLCINSFSPMKDETINTKYLVVRRGR